MFSIFVKNINLSIILLFLVNKLVAIDFKTPKTIVGTFDAGLYLKKDLAKGYTLSHDSKQSGSFKYTWYLDDMINYSDNATEFFNL